MLVLLVCFSETNLIFQKVWISDVLENVLEKRCNFGFPIFLLIDNPLDMRVDVVFLHWPGARLLVAGRAVHHGKSSRFAADQTHRIVGE